MQATGDPYLQPLERELAVAGLAARLLCHRTDTRPAARHEADALLVAQRARRRDVEARLDARGGDVGVLATRAGRAACPNRDLGERDGEAGGDLKRVAQADSASPAASASRGASRSHDA